MGSDCGTVGMSTQRRFHDGGTYRICQLSLHAAHGRTLLVHTCWKCCSTCIPPEDVLPETKPLDPVPPKRKVMPRTGRPDTAQRQCMLSFSYFSPFLSRVGYSKEPISWRLYWTRLFPLSSCKIRFHGPPFKDHAFPPTAATPFTARLAAEATQNYDEAN
jgi:hypothetical protein